MSEESLRPSVVYRTGRLTKEDYDEAIETLVCARDEDPSKCCGSCGDGGHTAETCHHNPLVLARLGAKKEFEYRCFHCGEVFNGNAAQEHFGKTECEDPSCLSAALARNKELEAVVLDILVDCSRQPFVGTPALTLIKRKALAALNEQGPGAPDFEGDGG